jgi:muconolactone delta-isomerase
MKILALEREIEGAAWDNMEKMLEQEAQHVFQLYLSDSLREIYFTEDKNAVLILEAKDKKAAEKLLNSLPLVKYEKIKFEIMELKPYSGFERIIKNAKTQKK